jgi:hypothetical protein
LEEWAVGRIFNTQMTDSALRAEAWLDEVALQRVSEETLERINNGEVIEVSIGIFSDEELVSGTWNTERYTAIARNHRPNHLALLPDEVGACSIADGCGIRVNKKEKTKMVEEGKISINEENQTVVLKELNRMGFSVNELGFNEIREKIGQAIYGLDGNGLDHYIEDVYTDSFVYTQYNNRIDPRQRKMYKQSYKVNDANEVEFVGEPTHVKREVSYLAVPMTNGRVKTERVIKKNSMCTDCVKKLADSLIANKETAWNENDREFLESQTEEVLEKMTPPAKSDAQVNSAKPTREEILAVFKDKPMTDEEFLSFTSPEVGLQIKEGLQLRANQKKTIVTEIIANTDQWTEDELNLKELSELQKIYKLVSKEEAVVFAAGGSVNGKSNVSVNANKNKPAMVSAKMKPFGVAIKEE